MTQISRIIHKVDGRNLLTYTSQAISQRLLKQKGMIHPSGLDIRIKTLQTTPAQVRIVPHKTHYVQQKQIGDSGRGLSLISL